MKKDKTYTLTMTGLFSAIICIATAFLKIPAPLGYVHLGDGMIFLASAFLGPYGALSAAVGSALADIFSGYAVYAPVTFLIKGVMGLVAWFFIKRFSFKTAFNIIGFILCEIIMTAGYFAFECAIYSVSGAIAGIFGNLIQAVFGVIIGTVSLEVLKRYKKLK